MNGKYGVSFLSKFKVIRNDADTFTTREPEEEQGWTPKEKRKRYPWQHEHNMETHLPAGKYTSLRSKFDGGGFGDF